MQNNIIKSGDAAAWLKKNTVWSLLCIVSGITVLFQGCDRKEKDNYSEECRVEVSSPIVKDSVIIYSSYPATLQSRSQADVVARVNGQLLKKHFENGAYVNKGQILFTIEPTIYQAAVNEANAQVNSALGQLDYAEKHLAALEQAFDANAVSEMDVIQARSARSQAQASVNQAKATLTTAATRLGYCNVTAPVSGRISAATLDVGSYISGEGAPVTLATIYDESDLQAQFNITDYEYAAISTKGDGFRNPVFRNIPVYISASETPDKSDPMFTANLSYEAPSVDSSTGNVLLKATINGNSETLRPGMYCKVQLPTSVENKALLIKDASISTDQRGKYVYVVNDSNTVVYTHIEIGELYEDTLRVVRKGLRPNDRYVTRAMINVRQGEKVIPVTSTVSTKH